LWQYDIGALYISSPGCALLCSYRSRHSGLYFDSSWLGLRHPFTDSANNLRSRLTLSCAEHPCDVQRNLIGVVYLSTQQVALLQLLQQSISLLRAQALDEFA
jgi:hypothetical protein